MSTVNKINVNGQTINIGGSGTEVPENITANDVAYDSSTQYDENTVGKKLSNISSIIEISDKHSNNEEIILTSDDESEIYLKINNNGIYSNNYYDMSGNLLELKNLYSDKVFAFYGDSITAQCNGDYQKPFSSGGWAKMIAEKINITKFYARGVGGQTYSWNNGGYYSKKDSTGNYINRYLANNGSISTSNGQINVIQYTTEQKTEIENVLGYEIEIHRGCFCSWDRITSMFPITIKDNINYLFIMGGTNDFSAVEETDSGEINSQINPKWSTSNTIDTDWVNSELYNGGDYDISNIWGGLASTIMKFRIWMPFCKIIILTPITRKGSNYNCPINGKNYTQKQLTDDIKYVANYCNCEIIDLFSECDINQFNINETLLDGVHPNNNGFKFISDCIVKKII